MRFLAKIYPFHAGYLKVLHSSPFLSNTIIIKHFHISRVENSVDPDQLASQKPADLDLHCF